METMKTQCCVVGGGPAGMMLGYLLARSGVKTIVLEKHKDFLRDFRGDTVHPSTTQVLADLGLLDRFLALPHQKVSRMGATFEGTRVTLADFSTLRTACPYITFMPQWDFLNFMAEEGRRFPGFRLEMESHVTGLLRAPGGEVIGVTGERANGEPFEVHADLVVGADGRHSTTRQAAGLVIEDEHASIDVFWFRVSRPAGGEGGVSFFSRGGGLVITIDRNEYLQCAYVVRKGDADRVRAEGLDRFRSRIGATVPALVPVIADIASWDDVKLLSVAVERLHRWNIPGLLCIGDAAHTMSPVGGVGINLAVQDAVAAAEILAPPLREGTLRRRDLYRVQARRMGSVRIVQAFQGLVQERILKPALSGRPQTLPLAVRLLAASAWGRHVGARFIGLGVRQERVRPLPASPHPATDQASDRLS